MLKNYDHVLLPERMNLKNISKKTSYKVAYAMIEVLMASFFIAICAQINIPLPFTPIPLSGQTFAVMLMGALLGPQKGAFSVFTYLLEGLMGLPVFSLGGCGLGILSGPRAGYLFGFAAQAYIAGQGAQRIKHERGTIIFATYLIAASFIQLTVGVLWLSKFFGMKFGLSMGLYPFLSVEWIKILAVIIAVKIMRI